MTFEEKELKRFKENQEREKREAKLIDKTGFKVIFPTTRDKLHRMRLYTEMIIKAKEVSDYFALGRYALRGK